MKIEDIKTTDEVLEIIEQNRITPGHPDYEKSQELLTAFKNASEEYQSNASEKLMNERVLKAKNAELSRRYVVG